MLFVVATPIGNLEDITVRAARVLGDVDVVACEDTRQTLKLLSHLNISTKLVSFHAHSLQKDLDHILQMLRDGKDIALVTDAGTPGISDPGYLLVSACVKADIPVVPLPGASAFLTALMASGVPTQEFTYYGFVPAKKGRQTFFRTLESVQRTQVFYESKHRIMTALDLLKEYVPDRTIVIARELTKAFETFYRGTPEEIALAFDGGVAQKGEFVVIVAARGFSFDEESVTPRRQHQKNKYLDKSKAPIVE